MTVCFYVYSIAKRAEAIALVDLGATENFMNLSYARWLKLLIQTLQQPCKIFNINRTVTIHPLFLLPLTPTHFSKVFP